MSGGEKVLVRERIREIRQEKGITQKAVAKHIGVSPANYYRLEKQSKMIQPELLIKIAEFLNVDIKVFFYSKTNKYC